LDHRIFQGRHQFLLRWKGFGPEDSTWEDEGNLNCPELIRAFKNQFRRKTTRGRGILWETGRLASQPFPELILTERLAPIEILSVTKGKGDWMYTFRRDGELLNECGSTLRLQYPVEMVDFLEVQIKRERSEST
jgi:hypothetical protein